MDAYLATAKADATLVGGPGSAGYDGGFWIRGGSFLLKTNLTLQTRYEYFDWNDRSAEPQPGGDLSGFSLPRATVKFSGDATCDIHYYTELEFGHAGSLFNESNNEGGSQFFFSDNGLVGTNQAIAQGFAQTSEQYYGVLREGWIEYEAAPAFAFRMGLIKTAATRQLMTPPEMQQFVDISMASGYIGQSMPGYSDRNRDYGFMLHGVLGCDGAWSYMLTVTNGDGPVHHNVVDGRTDDPLAYSARVNWDIVGHAGYEEGALRQTTCGWVASVGGWAHYFVDHLLENALVKRADRLTWGFDAAVGYGGFSLTAAYSGNQWDNTQHRQRLHRQLVAAAGRLPVPRHGVGGGGPLRRVRPRLRRGLQPGRERVRRRGELLHRRARRQADARCVVHHLRVGRQLVQRRLLRLQPHVPERRDADPLPVAARAVAGG